MNPVTEHSMLLKCIENPDLMAELEKLAKSVGGSAEVVKRPRKSLVKAFVAEITETCNLCEEVSTKFALMSWDANTDCQCFRIETQHCYNIWPDLPLKQRPIYSASCPACPTNLMDFDKEHLVMLLLRLSNKKNI